MNDRFPQLLDWLKSLPYYCETNNYIFTHAGVDTTTNNWKDSNFQNEVWDDGSFIIRVCNNISDKKIVVEHFSTDKLREKYNIDLNNIGNNKILYYENKIFMDSNVIDSIKINVLILDDEINKGI